MGSAYHKSSSLSEENAAQKAYTIGGVPVIFPYKAYPSQIAMMDKIIKCLNKRQNCLLESPTGSGKSLALLCAALAWLKKTKREIMELETMHITYPNVYGRDTVTNNINCTPEKTNKSEPTSEKFSCYSCSKIAVKTEISGKSAKSNKFRGEERITTQLSSPNKNIDIKSINHKTHSSHLNKSEAMYSEGKFCENPSDYLKKRSTTHSGSGEILENFQPLKKNKLFPSEKNEIPVASSLQDCGDSKIESPQKHFKISSNFDSGSACSSQFSPNNEVRSSTLPSELPKIYFGTRTHKQIAQIIRELKKTPYKDVKMTILSSRERTCIHPKNSKARNKNEGCDELIKREEGPACRYYINIRKFYVQPPDISTAFDLEDFVSTCKQRQICPYFGARELLPAAEIIFCPYNYLVDPLIRDALNISLNGNIIIMDEAHNIEDSAREAASSCISVSQLDEAIADALEIGQLKREGFEPYMHIAKVLENFKKWLENSQDLSDYVTFDSSSKVWSGDDMLAILNYVGLGPDTFPFFQASYVKITQDENEVDKNEATEFSMLSLSGSTHVCLKNLTEVLNCMYQENLIYVPDYRFVIVKSKPHSRETSFDYFSQFSKSKPLSSAFEITVNFWCLNPAVAFSNMKDIHSIIVASGTLAPLTSFQSELGIPFQISLEANHVVSSERMWIGTIGKGPSNKPLNGTFQNASTFIYQDDVGNLILKVCTLIPHGILCFLPSYGMLDKLINRWKITSLWDKLLLQKMVLCEPRQANDFQQVIEDFYDAVKDSENNVGSGALFLAVCRGKVSEGLDFADNNARAVITIGIPFPNIKDAQVDLKKKYNDLHSSKRQIVTGAAWYEMQAFRAVNQALGRCIRHKDDFGALIIVDERFQKYDRYTAALSKWIKRDLKHYSTCHEAFESLNSFAEQMGLKISNTE